MTKEVFLSLYSISELDLEEAKIDWKELSLIIKEYEKIDENLHAKWTITFCFKLKKEHILIKNS